MPLVPTVPEELGKEEKAWDRVQLHLPAAARPYMRVGQSCSLSGVNSHRAKAGAGTTVLVVTHGFGTSDSACSGGSRPECCWAPQELSQQGLGCSGSVHPLANQLA